MESEIERRRRIDNILSPSLEKANKLASALKSKSDSLTKQIAEAQELVNRSRLRAQAVKKASLKKNLATPKKTGLKVKFK